MKGQNDEKFISVLLRLMKSSSKIKDLLKIVEKERLIEKKLKPVTVVGKITTYAQKLFPDDKSKDILQIIQDTYIKLLVNNGMDPIRARQSWVVASGGNFEGYVRNHINQVLNSKGIVAIKGERLKILEKNPRKLMNLLSS